MVYSVLKNSDLCILGKVTNKVTITLGNPEFHHLINYDANLQVCLPLPHPLKLALSGQMAHQDFRYDLLSGWDSGLEGP